MSESNSKIMIIYFSVGFLFVGLIALSVFTFLYILPKLGIPDITYSIIPTSTTIIPITTTEKPLVDESDIQNIKENSEIVDTIMSLQKSIVNLSNMQKKDIVDLKQTYIPNIVSNVETKIKILDTNVDTKIKVVDSNSVTINNNLLQLKKSLDELKRSLEELKVLHSSDIKDLKMVYIPNLIDNLQKQIITLKNMLDNIVKEDLANILSDINDVRELNKSQTDEIVGILSDFYDKMKGLGESIDSKQINFATDRNRWMIKMVDNNLCLTDANQQVFYCINDKKDLIQIKK